MPLVQEIRNEVRKLSKKTTIWEKITALETQIRGDAAVQRLIAPTGYQVCIPSDSFSSNPELILPFI
jgi:hypothetical protein